MIRAFVFPGQGAQSVGMGRDLAEAWPEAREVFERVDDALGERLSAIIWEGDAETLTLTANAQPALMATSMAALAALRAEGVGIEAATYVAGHSLGEYSALCAAGAIGLEDTARLLRIRGEAMQKAVPPGEGAMAAILGLDYAAVAAIADRVAGPEVCAAANDNDPAQVVVSGHAPAVSRAAEAAKEAGAKRAVILPVSAPFHCALMEPAARAMAVALDAVRIADPAVPVVANVTARPETAADAIRTHLVEQVTGTVRWRESVAALAAHGVSEAWEIGAGKALSGMIRRIDRSIATRTVGTADEIRAAAESLGG